MDTKVWGPDCWRFLHHIPEQYTPERYTNISSLFQLLPNVLPCIYCRVSLKKFYLECPFPSKKSITVKIFRRWLIDIHNLVNEKLSSQGCSVQRQPKEIVIRELYTVTPTKAMHGGSKVGSVFIGCILYNTRLVSEHRETIVQFVSVFYVLHPDALVRASCVDYLGRNAITGTVKNETLKQWFSSSPLGCKNIEAQRNLFTHVRVVGSCIGGVCRATKK